MSSKEHLLSEFEIKSLVIRERFYRDSCQWDKLRQSYHPDASKTHIKISWFTGDIDGFVNGSIKMASSGTASAHTIQPVEVKLNKNKALVISTGSVNIRSTLDELECDVVSWVRFVSQLARVDGPSGLEWKFLTLECIYDRDSVVPTRPLKDHSLVIQTHPEARASYKYLEWVLARRGYTIGKDLPGTDDEPGVKRLIERNEQWLNV